MAVCACACQGLGRVRCQGGECVGEPTSRQGDRSLPRQGVRYEPTGRARPMRRVVRAGDGCVLLERAGASPPPPQIERGSTAETSSAVGAAAPVSLPATSFQNREPFGAGSSHPGARLSSFHQYDGHDVEQQAQSTHS